MCVAYTGDDHYSVKFIPSGPGVHLLRPMYGGRDVRGEYLSFVKAWHVGGKLLSCAWEVRKLVSHM